MVNLTLDDELTYYHTSFDSEAPGGFHVNRLNELLGFGNNTVTTETLVNFEDLPSKPHVPEKILDVKTKHLCFKTIQKLKIKWMDKCYMGTRKRH